MEEQIRLAAFQWLKEQTLVYGDVLPRAILEKGFEYSGERVTLVGPSGIWKPRVLDTIPLSITTIYDGPYEDSFNKDGFLVYRYRGVDYFHRDNTGLREAMKQQVPLIYFHSIVQGKYLVVWPVYIIQDNPDTLSFTVAADDLSSVEHYLRPNIYSRLADDAENARRSYITSTIKNRLHQRSFRERVLYAYQQQCAFCNLKHTQLLDAAHIIADGEELGDPIVVNGLSLCKIHHAAFDSNILGVTPDYKIIVQEEILKETDGPMLKHGIQELQNQRIILPSNKKLWPDQERLSIRYTKFKYAG